jgi:hypothetical protein
MKKPGNEKPARTVQSPPKKTTVQRLYDPPESSGRTECEETQKSGIYMSVLCVDCVSFVQQSTFESNIDSFHYMQYSLVFCG